MARPNIISMGRNKAPPVPVRTKDLDSFYRDIELDVLARTLWGEARGQGVHGMEAIANIVLNRVKIAQDNNGKFWWGSNIIQVCQKPYQFSCWNRSDPAYRQLQEADSTDLYFATALRISQRAVAGTLQDNVNGGTHYHSRGSDPYWARGETPVATVGDHIFYRLEG